METDMKNSLTKKAALIIVTGFTFMASACNTIEGVGEDLESAGDKAQEVTKKK
jgi:predicted small secreted protein